MNDEQILEIAEEQSSDALTPEHRAFCINFARALLSASESAEPVALPSLKPRLLNQLRRFNECCQDSQAGGHDVDKEDMQSLAEFGAVRPAPGGRHYLTDFGAYVLACAAPRPIEAPDMLARAVANAEHEQSLDAYIEAPAQAVALSEQDLADVRDAAKILAYEDSVKGALGMRLTSLAHRLATANKPVDDSRERFWCELRAIHDPDDLNKHEIELAWSMWQARAALSAPISMSAEAVEIVKRIKDAAQHWGGWSGTAGQCDRLLELFAAPASMSAAPPAQSTPDGWKVVPVEPTPIMRKAAADAWLNCDSKMVLNKAAAAARAAISAAPSPEKQS